MPTGKAALIAWGASVVVALALGFAIGRGSGPAASAVAEMKSKRNPAAVTKTAQALPNSDGFELGNDGGSRDGQRPAGKSLQDQLSSAMNLSDPKTRERQMENALGEAGLDGVKKSLDWALGLPDGPNRRALLRKIMERWGQLDGQAAAAYGAKVFEETGNIQLLRDAVRGWGQANPENAMQYAQGLATGEGVRRDIMRDVLRDWADRNPQASAAYATSAGLDLGRGGAVRMVADRWSQQDPKAAAAWALSLPPGEDQRRALDALIGNWSSLDLQAAADFVNGQPAGQTKEAMVSRLAREIAGQDPAAALQWTASISDPATQTRTAMGIIFRSAGRDTAAVTQMVQTSPLSPQVQQAVLDRVNEISKNGWWPRGGDGPP